MSHVHMNGSGHSPRTTRPARRAGRVYAVRVGSRDIRPTNGQDGGAGRGSIVAEALPGTAALERAGFRFGARGTQSSRSIMLRELGELLGALPPDASRADYTVAIVDENILGKPTHATRQVTRQRLVELYALDPAVPLFRVLRRLWAFDRRDPHGHALLALLSALARDPLLRLTAMPVLALAPGEALARAEFRAAIRACTGSRFNDAVLDKVAGNAASSWTQSGHLEGRMRRVRRTVAPTPTAVAMALWLGEAEGLAGLPLIDSRWAAVLDLPGGTLLPHAMEARRLGLIHLSAAGNVVEVSTRMLDPPPRPGPGPTEGSPSHQKSCAARNPDSAP